VRLVVPQCLQAIRHASGTTVHTVELPAASGLHTLLNPVIHHKWAVISDDGITSLHTQHTLPGQHMNMWLFNCCL
jgi:hypothetical protein